MNGGGAPWALGALLLLLGSGSARAQSDEIQVYTGEIADPGQLTLTFHDNFTPIGRTQPDFPGGVVPDRALNGVTEFGLGVRPWFELGAYLPILYTLDRNGHFFVDGAKLRALFVKPDAARARFYYGVNFELSYNRPFWAQSPWQLETRFILGAHWGSWSFTVNPILDVALEGHKAFSFAPSTRVACSVSKSWGLGLELYEDFGPLGGFVKTSQQQQTLFGVVDVSGKYGDVEIGVGHGFTRQGSDPLVLKLIYTPRLGGAGEP